MKLIFALMLSVVAVRGAERPPNIVFILADDLGITDIGAYARHFTAAKQEELFYETPNLDRLASDGIVFSQSYANQLCSPTRAAIMTGRIASRMGVTTATPNTKTYFNQGLAVPEGCSPYDAYDHQDPIKGKRPWINAHSSTGLDPAIPSWPRVLGGHDCAFLGKWHLGGHGVPGLQPAAHGFEELAFYDSGASSYFKWRGDWDRTKPFFETMPGEFRIGKSGVDTRLAYLTDDLNARAVEFLKSRKAKQKPFVLYYCSFAVHSPFQAPEDGIKYFAAKKQIGHMGRNNATYAEMLKKLDDSVGEIRATLEETGLAENTVLIFTSDNGGVEYTNPPATDNQPFKGGKACLYEGGVRVPTIVWQPGRYEGGKWCDAVVDCTDFLPTVAELTGNKIPDGVDGKSMLPLLNNPSSHGPERTLIWHYPFNVSVKDPNFGTPLSPHSAIRVGDYKMIWDWQGRLELYDIPQDLGETHDLAKEKPELTAKLHQQLKNWLKENVAQCYWPKRDANVTAEEAKEPFPFVDLRYPIIRPSESNISKP